MKLPHPSRLVGVATLSTLLSMPCLAAETAGAAQPPPPDQDSVQRMQREIEEMKAEIRALKERIETLARASGTASGASAASTPPAPEPAPPPEAEAPAPPPPPRAAGSANVFNPAISAVFQGIGASSIDHNRDGDGFTLSEAEVGLQAVVDPYARVDLFLSFGAQGEADVEEGYMTLQTLPGGLQAKAGRFKSAFGKWNTLHDHAFFTVDRPDALTSFFGDESLSGDGVSLSWLVPGTGPVYLESISEVTSTGNDVSFNARRRDPLFLERLDALFTLTSNATLGLGLSAAAGKAGPTAALLDAIDAAGLPMPPTPTASLPSNVFGADLTWKWKPVQFNVYRSFTWQTEALVTHRDIESLDAGGFLDRNTVRAFGGYTYAEYQFAKRWRAGVRYDVTELPDDADARIRSVSGVLRIQPTEFEELRIQFKHSGRNDPAALRFDDTRSDNEIFIEWIPVIGAHAAHKY